MRLVYDMHSSLGSNWVEWECYNAVYASTRVVGLRAYENIDIWYSELFTLVPLYFTNSMYTQVAYYSWGSLGLIFSILYLWYILVCCGMWGRGIYGGLGEARTSFVQLYLYSWIWGGEDKVESMEEVICLVILWPWCVYLVFSHLVGSGGQNFLFGFAEWGLPVIYGLILLGEHIWTFGTYIGVYLIGVRGRKSLSITWLEDCIAFSIMVARILLQMIRGVIVGMFHFICREALLNMGRWWSVEVWFSGSSGFGYSGGSVGDYIGVICDIILGGGSLVVIMAIMFLQLVFLIVCIWLFCRCWFISWARQYTWGNFQHAL